MGNAEQYNGTSDLKSGTNPWGFCWKGGVYFAGFRVFLGGGRVGFRVLYFYVISYLFLHAE